MFVQIKSKIDILLAFVLQILGFVLIFELWSSSDYNNQ